MGRADRQLAVMQIDTRRALNNHRFRSAWRPSRQNATSRAEPAFRAHFEPRAGAIEMLAVVNTAGPPRRLGGAPLSFDFSKRGLTHSLGVVVAQSGSIGQARV
jgi:hypothetical protein